MKTRKTRLAYSIFVAVLFVLPAFAFPQAPFYQGKTITIISAREPGGTGDLRVRAVMPFLQKYIPGSPTIALEFMPGGGGRKAANHLYRAVRPDGLTIANIGAGFVSNAVLGQPVNGRRLDEGMARDADVIPAQVIHQDHDHVGGRRGATRRRAPAAREHYGRERSQEHPVVSASGHYGSHCDTSQRAGDGSTADRTPGNDVCGGWTPAPVAGGIRRTRPPLNRPAVQAAVKGGGSRKSCGFLCSELPRFYGDGAGS